MKRVVLCTLTVVLAAVGSIALADIQAPPCAKYGVFRKLSRGVTNIFYGSAEIPYTWNRVRESEGSVPAFSYGILYGAQKTAVRLGYGLYEVVTFPFPTYKKGYAPPMMDARKYGDLGYEEFPPALGFASEIDYSIPDNSRTFY